MTQTQSSDYETARVRVLRKRKFKGDVVAYVVINAFLVGIWAVSGFGYFWPGWVLAGWGVLLLLDGWDAFYRHGVTEDDIQRELQTSSASCTRRGSAATATTSLGGGRRGPWLRHDAG